MHNNLNILEMERVLELQPFISSPEPKAHKVSL